MKGFNNREFVRTLDSHDLYRLQELIKEELEIIENSTKKVVWCVYNGCYTSYFEGKDYNKAVDMLLSAVQKVSAKECEDFLKYNISGDYPVHLFRKNQPTLTVERIPIKEYNMQFNTEDSTNES